MDICSQPAAHWSEQMISKNGLSPSVFLARQCTRAVRVLECYAARRQLFLLFCAETFALRFKFTDQYPIDSPEVSRCLDSLLDNGNCAAN